MAIIGKFRVEIPKNTLRNMKIDTAGYIFSTDFILSRGLLCIPLDTEVFYSIEEIIELDFDYYIAVYKIENGTKSNSFDLDLEEYLDFSIKNWYICPEAITKQYLKSSDWICFPDPPIFYEEFDYEEECYEDTDQIKSDVKEVELLVDNVKTRQDVFVLSTTIKGLSNQLDEVLNTENYELAAVIRDEILRRIEKTKE